MSAIRIGAFRRKRDYFVSANAIERDLLDRFLPRYADVVPLPVTGRGEMLGAFEQLERHRLDYLYVDTRDFLLDSYLLRERLGRDLPLLCFLHSVAGFLGSLVYVVPLLRETDVVVAPSRFAARSFGRISREHRVRVAPFALDLDRIRESAAPPGEGRRGCLTFMGQLIREKGLDVLVECLPEIAGRVPDARLKIIGPLSGSYATDLFRSRYVQSLQEKIERLGLADRVRFEGFLEDGDKYESLSRSDLFVSLTTAPFETFHMVNLEALSCGVPVITTRWAASGEFVRHGENGYLIDVANDSRGYPRVDRGQFVARAVELLTRRDRLEAMRARALESVRPYDYRRVIPGLLRHLRKKGAGPGGRGDWDRVRGKAPVAFPALYEPRVLAFLEQLGRGRKTYGEVAADLFPGPTGAVTGAAPPGGGARADREDGTGAGGRLSRDRAREVRRGFLDYMHLRDGGA